MGTGQLLRDQAPRYPLLLRVEDKAPVLYYREDVNRDEYDSKRTYFYFQSGDFEYCLSLYELNSINRRLLFSFIRKYRIASSGFQGLYQ